MIVEAFRINPASGAALKRSDVAPGSAVAEAIKASAPTRVASSSGEGLRELVAAANRATKSLNNALGLSLDSQSGTPIVRVIDTETGQIIRQIPTEEALDLRRALERIAGLLINRTA